MASGTVVSKRLKQSPEKDVLLVGVRNQASKRVVEHDMYLHDTGLLPTERDVQPTACSGVLPTSIFNIWSYKSQIFKEAVHCEAPELGSVVVWITRRAILIT